MDISKRFSLTARLLAFIGLMFYNLTKKRDPEREPDSAKEPYRGTFFRKDWVHEWKHDTRYEWCFSIPASQHKKGDVNQIVSIVTLKKEDGDFFPMNLHYTIKPNGDILFGVFDLESYGPEELVVIIQ